MKYLYGFAGTRGVARNPRVSGCGFVPVPVRVRVLWVQVRVGPRGPVPDPCATLLVCYHMGNDSWSPWLSGSLILFLMSSNEHCSLLSVVPSLSVVYKDVI